MQSPDDYDFDDPHHQADLDGIIERLLARRRVDRSRHDDPITIMLDRISDPFRIEKPSDEPIRPAEPIKPVEKPLPEALPAASSVDELRANLGNRRKRGGRKVQPLSDKPTLDLELIEKMFSMGATLAQIRDRLRVGATRLKLELLQFLPHIAEEASKRRGRKPKDIDIEQVRQMREEGIALFIIARQLGVDYKRLVAVVSVDPSLKRRLGSVDTDEVLRLHTEGLTQEQIAAEVGCGVISVYRRIKQARLDEEAAEQQAEEAKVRALRAQGWGWKRIAAELHAGRDRLRSMYGEASSSS